MARVLIADDELQILEAMVDVLESAGHEVMGVSNGEEALHLLKAKQFDVALIDVMMPRLDGYHLAQRLHALPHRPRVAIVTSRDFNGDKHALKGAGVEAFLQKPFANRDLLDLVTTLSKKK